MSIRNLVVIFGDQLNKGISSLNSFDKDKDHILIAEVWEEACYIKHHKKKLCLIFAAMRHFGNELQQDGYKVSYHHLEDTKSSSFESVIIQLLTKFQVKKILVTSPSEYRVYKKVTLWNKLFSIPVDILNDARFICSKDEFKEWAEGKKSLVMEFFYRQMRKKHDILMEKGKPIGGAWNYDKQNRKSNINKEKLVKPKQTKPDQITLEVIDLVKRHFPSHFGEIDDFYYAVNRKCALQVLRYFITHQLALFGDYQDVMVEDEPWLYHSILSLYINIGLLLPMECIQAALNQYSKGLVPINAVEGYIRQILGWREYVNGIYWLKMPDYESLNYLEAQARLPDFYWDGNTTLNCIKQCVNDTYKNAYAHHIQRLMVLGNFLLLIGVHPEYVNEWYLTVYADAYEWVEMPNVTGMVLFADGGLLGSKPYAASGSYINKMSNYCKNCRYNVNKKNGEDACPFNYLYWNFVGKNKSKLAKNQRMRMIYNTFNKMSEDKIASIENDSKKFLSTLTSTKYDDDQIT